MIKRNLPFVIAIITVIVLVLGGIVLGFHLSRLRKEQEVVEGGTVKSGILKGYEEDIKSKDIVSFEYICGDFKVSCKLNNNELFVESKGGYSNNRDGNYFVLEYKAKDNNILKELQKIVEKYNLSKDNGYEHVVGGLPAGLGDTLSVTYKSNEKIWKYSNQSRNVSDEASKEIYDAFHKCAKENGYDFTSEGSNIDLYNDADIDYVQGIWNGTHFGSKYKVVINGNNIKIYKDDKLTDDTEFKIIEGDIVKNKLKKGVWEPKDRYDYEEFSEISIFRKKNDFTMTMYFMKNSYSTDDLIKEK